MKRLLLTILACMAVALCATAQTQQGYVKTPGRLGSNGQVIAGKRLSGATVQIKGRGKVVSGANGTFSFPIPANKFSIQSVKKQGYILTDPEATSRQYTYSSNPLILVMETPGQQADSKLANEKKIRRSLQRQLQAKEDELEALKEQNRINEEEYRQQLQRIYQEQEDNEKLISDMAERYSQIDFDQLDEFNLRISDCILNGRLTEADSLLRSKGDIQSRIARLQRDKAALAAEEAELAQRQENLDKGKTGAQATMNDIAQDCYNYYQKFLMEHQNDSAAHYLELRAALDTTNFVWQNQAGRFLDDYLANYALALDYYQLGLSQALAQDGEQSEWVATFINNIGLVYRRQGDYSLALEYCQKALSIVERVLGPDHPYVATSYNSIGTVYGEHGDYSRALEYYQKALSIYERVLGPDHLDVALLYHNIGMVYYSQGDYARALEYHQKALAIFERVLAPDHPNVATSYNSIGLVYKSQGDYSLALEYFQKALSIFERVYGPDHPDVATSYNNIGLVYYSQGDYARALECYQKSLAIKEQVYGPDHPDVALSYNNIGMVYDSQGDYARALDYSQKSLAIYERVYGPDHPYVAPCYCNLAYVYYKMEDLVKSLEYNSKAYEIYLKAFGPDHPQTQDVKGNIDCLKDVLLWQ